MVYKVIMPKAGMAMETGKIVKWLKKEGDSVETGEPLLEIETDKVNMEVEAMNSGVLLKIIAHEGEDIPVVQTIGYIGEKGEPLPKNDKPEKETITESIHDHVMQFAALERDGAKIPATPAVKRIAKEMGIKLEGLTPSGSLGQLKAVDIEKAKLIKATMLAKKMADDMNVDISGLKGSGYGGKATKSDVQAAARTQRQTKTETEILPLSAMRRTIAKRMLQSHLELPTVTQNSIADVTEIVAFRKKINLEQNDIHVSFNDLIILAVAKTLREQPYINVSFTEDGLVLKKHINIGIAVALPEGLVVPVINDADTLSIFEISRKAKTLAKKAKEGKLSPDEYTGGTFTISNLGMMGITSFTPIVNSPESAILGVCATQQVLEMDDCGKIEKHFKMGLSLTFDHRSIDGAQAAIFSNRVAELLQNPIRMLI